MIRGEEFAGPVSRRNSPQLDPTEFYDAPAEDETARCVKLWRAVLGQALMDIMYFRPRRSPDDRPDTVYTAQARVDASAWIMGGGPDFLQVCGWAHMDPALIRARAAEAMNGPQV